MNRTQKSLPLCGLHSSGKTDSTQMNKIWTLMVIKCRKMQSRKRGLVGNVKKDCNLKWNRWERLHWERDGWGRGVCVCILMTGFFSSDRRKRTKEPAFSLWKLNQILLHPLHTGYFWMLITATESVCIYAHQISVSVKTAGQLGK